jgi:hypothetical protein
VLFRKRSRLRPLSERECYLRLHGVRSGEIEVVRGPREQAPRMPATRAPAFGAVPAPAGPTDERPALHLVIRYPRGAATVTGEQVRLDLLRRMAARTDEAV